MAFNGCNRDDARARLSNQLTQLAAQEAAWKQQAEQNAADNQQWQGEVDADGFVAKQLIVDLLNLADPKGISGQPQADALGLGNPFMFPFVTIESVLIVDPSTLLVINDNNYPFSTGRRKTQPDDEEFIQIHLNQPLNVTAHG